MDKDTSGFEAYKASLLKLAKAVEKISVSLKENVNDADAKLQELKKAILNTPSK